MSRRLPIAPVVPHNPQQLLDQAMYKWLVALSSALSRDKVTSLEIRDTSASRALPTTPTVFVAPTIATQDELLYDTSTGVVTFIDPSNYTFIFTVNANPSSANKNVYFYAEANTGAGTAWVPIQYSARQYTLSNTATAQLLIAADKAFQPGYQIRFYLWGDATVTLVSTNLPGTTPGTVTLAGFRCQIVGG